MTWVRCDAVIEGRYRYSLERLWSPRNGLAVWIMLNPSTADAARDDPTIRRCLRFTRDLGLGGLIVVNLFAYRTSKPSDLLALRQNEAIGPRNNEWIGYEVRRSKLVVAAWGSQGLMWGRETEVRGLLDAYHIKPKCFGLTKDRQPKHPLYLPADSKLVDFT